MSSILNRINMIEIQWINVEFSIYHYTNRITSKYTRVSHPLSNSWLAQLPHIPMVHVVIDPENLQDSSCY